jgi:hypothetical protein
VLRPSGHKKKVSSSFYEAVTTRYETVIHGLIVDSTHAFETSVTLISHTRFTQSRELKLSS